VEVREEVVNRLGEDACPIDRIDGTETVLFVERVVGKEGLDYVL